MCGAACMAGESARRRRRKCKCGEVARIPKAQKGRQRLDGGGGASRGVRWKAYNGKRNKRGGGAGSAGTGVGWGGAASTAHKVGTPVVGARPHDCLRCAGAGWQAERPKRRGGSLGGCRIKPSVGQRAGPLRGERRPGPRAAPAQVRWRAGGGTVAVVVRKWDEVRQGRVVVQGGGGVGAAGGGGRRRR